MAAAAVFAWAFAVLALFEVRHPLPVFEAARVLSVSVHSAFSDFSLIVTARSGMSGLRAVASFLVLQASLCGFGAPALRWMGAGRGPAAVWLAGAVLASLALLGVALTGLYGAAPLAVLAMAAAAPAGLREWRKRGEWSARLGEWKSGGLLARGAFAVSAAALAATGLALLAPETGLDALQYHAALPARALALHKLVPLESNFVFSLPVQGELLRGWGLALGGDGGMRLWGLAALAAGGAALAGFAGTGLAWRRVAFASWVSSPFAAGLALAGKPDLFLAPFALAALGLSARWGRAAALLAGALAGAVVSFKMTALPFAAILFLVTAARFRAAGWRGIGGASALFLAGAAALGGPWLVKAWLETGDPLYPFLKAGFGMPAAAVDILREFSSMAALRGEYSSWTGKLLSFWTSTMTDGLSPLWLALAPLAVMFRGGGKSGPALLASAALGWAAWVFVPQARYGTPWLACLGAATLAGLAAAAVRAPRAAAALAAVLLASQVGRLLVSPDMARAWLAGAGLEDRGRYFGRMLGTYAGMGRSLEALPPRARILVVGERRSYPGPRAEVLSSLHEPFAAYPLIRESGSPAGLARRMRQLGITHVVHNNMGAIYFRSFLAVYPWTEGNLRVWTDYWSRHARLLAVPERVDMDEGGYYLYALSRESRSPAALPTLPGVAGVFASIEGCVRMGMPAKAYEMAQVLEKIAGSVPEVRYFLGKACYGQDRRKSLEYLVEADRGGLASLDLWADIARLYEEEGSLRSALSYVERIRRNDPRVGAGEQARLMAKMARPARRAGGAGE